MMMELSTHAYYIKYVSEAKKPQAWGSNPSHCLFLYGLRDKDILYIFKWLKNNQEKDNFITHKNYMKFKFLHL